MKKEKFIDLDNTRRPEQRTAMERIAKRGHCPLCPGNLKLEHKKPIIREGKHWLVTTSQWPYKNTKEHFFLIAREHAERISDMPQDAFEELGEHLRWLEVEKNISGGCVSMRFGDTRLSSGTINHIHVQVVVPDIEAPDFEPIRIKVGTKT